MNIKKEAVMTWEEAPDVLTLEEYAKVSRIGKKLAEANFKKNDFPLIPGTENKQVVDKISARLYNMGISTKSMPKQSLDFLILMELKQINEAINNTLTKNTGKEN